MPAGLTYDESIAYLNQFINYEVRPRVAYDPEHFNLSAFDDFLESLGAPHCHRQAYVRPCSANRIWSPFVNVLKLIAGSSAVTTSLLW